jgi:hypothetical protein
MRLGFEIEEWALRLGPDAQPHGLFWIDDFDGRQLSFVGRATIPELPDKPILCDVAAFACLPRGAVEAQCDGFAWLFDSNGKDTPRFSLALGLPDKVWMSLLRLPYFPPKAARFTCLLPDFELRAPRDAASALHCDIRVTIPVFTFSGP